MDKKNCYIDYLSLFLPVYLSLITGSIEGLFMLSFSCKGLHKKVVIFFFTFQNLTFIISQDWNTEMKLTEKNMSLIGSVHCKKGEFSLLSVSISCICVFGA